jgi:hypothetical protein
VRAKATRPLDVLKKWNGLLLPVEILELSKFPFRLTLTAGHQQALIYDFVGCIHARASAAGFCDGSGLYRCFGILLRNKNEEFGQLYSITSNLRPSFHGMTTWFHGKWEIKGTLRLIMAEGT